MNLLQKCVLVGVCAFSLAQPCLAENKKAPEVLPFIYTRRSFATNCSWSQEHARMGGNDLSIYIMGHGGEADSTYRTVLERDHENKFEMFEAIIGYLDTAPEGRGATFEVWVNGTKVASKGPIFSGDPPQTIRANIKGAKDIQLRIVPERYNDTFCATWGNPMLSTIFEEESDTPTLSVSGEGHSYIEVPNSFKGVQEINFPFPIYPGTNEFLLHTEYDAKKNVVKYTITHEGSHPEVGATIVRRVKE